MIQEILLLAIIPCYLSANYYDDEETSKRKSFPKMEEVEFEPVNPLPRDKDKMATAMKNLNCEEFSRYTLNCTLEAALEYNSSRKAPPMPAKINDWCKAIRHLTNCAIDWNSECRDVTESHFNEESIKGHMHVVDNVCDDEWFLSRYDDLPICIEATSDVWEACYSTFKLLVDEQKNKSREWTHYETHFYMCCARAAFRRCTLDSLFSTDKCSQEQAATLQKFSIIVSEGDVYQDCESNMMYANCPGGDPRPSTRQLNKLMAPDNKSDVPTSKSSTIVLTFVLYCYFYFYCV
ncbi:hypothetical protein evm_011634 [Chilo suppressalis]|nr:hypothetical protein evm_011634 [Chilo suppressalis]